MPTLTTVFEESPSISDEQTHTWRNQFRKTFYFARRHDDDDAHAASVFVHIYTEYVAIWPPDSFMCIYYIITITIRWKRQGQRSFSISLVTVWRDSGNISIIISLICLYSPHNYTTHVADVTACNNYVFDMQTHLSCENCQLSPSNPCAPTTTTTTTMTVYTWIFMPVSDSSLHVTLKSKPYGKCTVLMLSNHSKNDLSAFTVEKDFVPCFYCLSPFRSTRSLSQPNTEKHSSTISYTEKLGFFLLFLHDTCQGT